MQRYKLKIPQNVTLRSTERCICIMHPFAVQKAKGLLSSQTALSVFSVFPRQRECTRLHFATRLRRFYALLRATQLGPRLKVVPEALDAFFANGDKKRMENQVYMQREKKNGENKKMKNARSVHVREEISQCGLIEIQGDNKCRTSARGPFRNERRRSPNSLGTRTFFLASPLQFFPPSYRFQRALKRSPQFLVECRDA